MIIKYNKPTENKKYIIIPETSGYLIGTEKVKINLPEYINEKVDISIYDNETSSDIQTKFKH